MENPANKRTDANATPTLRNHWIFSYSFYSVPYSLDFRVKRYQWYQSARSISRCISSAVRVCAFACLKSTLSRIALSAQLKAMSA